MIKIENLFFRQGKLRFLMDSKIPKPAGARKPLFDFTSLKRGNEGIAKKPLAGNIIRCLVKLFSQNVHFLEVNTAVFSQFKFQRDKSPDVFRPNPKEEIKLRRSKSEHDLRLSSKVGNAARAGTKRFQPTLENVPSKRLKMTSRTINSRPQLNIKTQEKKNAIISTVKSSAAATSSLVTRTNAITKKPPLVKSSSDSSKLNAAKAAQKSTAPANKSTSAVASKNIAKPRKIPAYDFKGRYHELKERFDLLKSKSDQQSEQICTLEEQAEGFGSLEKDLQDKIEKLEQELFDVTEVKEKLEHQLQTIQSSFEKEIQSLKESNSDLTMKNKVLSLDLSEKNEILKSTKKNLEDVTQKHEKQTIEFEELQQVSGTLKRDFEDASTKLSLSQDQLYLINIERKVLHNMVLDLRGNIRVFARVRPPLDIEENRGLCGWSFSDDSSLEIISNELVQGGNRKQSSDFSFDQVFNPNTTQEEIFEMVSPLIQSAMDGYNICIFAYGEIKKI